MKFETKNLNKLMNLDKLNLGKLGLASKILTRSNQTRRYLMIGGIVLGVAAALTYPAILLYRRIKANRMKNQVAEDTHVKSFAPNYRGNHKPHHRKVEKQSLA
jgi:hypothetical protein